MEKFDLENFPTSVSANKMLGFVSGGFYDKSYVGKWLYQVMGLEYDKALKMAEELPYQMFPETATWGLMYHEMKWGLPVREHLTYEERRKLIYQKRDVKAPMTPYRIEEYLKNVTDFEVHVADVHDSGIYNYKDSHPNRFKVTFLGKGTLDAGAVRETLNRIKQSHTDFILNEHIDVLFFILIMYETMLCITSMVYPRYNLPEPENARFCFYPAKLSVQAFLEVQVNYVYRIQMQGMKARIAIRNIVAKLRYEAQVKSEIREKEYRLSMKTSAQENTCNYKLCLTTGYHLTRYNGEHRYDGSRRYDSAIIKEVL